LNFLEFREELSRLSKPGKGFKPHKYLLLLSVIELVRNGKISNNRIYFNEPLKEQFRILIRTYGGDEDRDRPHTPFFHLASASFWKLIPNTGCLDDLNAIDTIGSAGDLNRLVAYAELDPSVFYFFKEVQTSAAIRQELDRLITAGIEMRTQSWAVHEPSPSYSLFEYESKAIDSIRTRVASHNLGTVLSNLNLHDDQTNRYFEADLVVIAEYGVYVVELKHWSGHIEVKPHSWVQNGSFFKHDPHIANNFKAKLLKGMYEHRFPQFPPIYFESVITFTNPETIVEGASVAATTDHNPTFATIERFIEYLRHQRKAKEPVLKQMHIHAFAEYVKKLQSTARPKDFVFPGYEVVERLYQSTERAEVIARRTDVRFKHLSRLRIFFTAGATGDSRVLHEQATATLNAVTKVGDHPNILKVWSVPNEDNFVVEGSDWSETGTLRDLLQREKTLSIELAKEIIGGILCGLDALHKECVVHRALSPENILMSGNIPKLMNFDLSYQLEDNRITVIPDVSRLPRSPYMAPEIYKGGVTPEASADLFSVGVILYEMIVGERPFGCSTDLERTSGQLSAAQQDKLIRRNVPPELRNLISDLIRQNQEQRPGTVGVVMGRLITKPCVPLPPQLNRQLSIGEKVGIYEIESHIKSGSQSQIYKATGMQGKQVAIKVFNTDIPLQRIVDEKENAGRVRAPSIVGVDGYGQLQDGRFFIAFGWVSSSCLRNEIDEGKRPDSERFRRIASQLLDAIKALHEFADAEGVHPILHNDIKPDNILLTDAERAVIIDFGSASEPHVGTYEGTAGYVAPDLSLGQDRKYCVDGDLYALGITLLEWLTGSRTVPDAGVSLPQGFPEQLIPWIVRATARTTEDRFPSAELMLTAIHEAFTPLSVITTLESLVQAETVTEIQEAPRTRVVPAKIQPVVTDAVCPNPFSAYLNSLHSRTAASENALAESQAINEFFGWIHVPHPLRNMIREKLLAGTRYHVILTGHAGDGKSTIAVELLKNLKGLPPEEPLKETLASKVAIHVGNSKEIVLIKDLSEWTHKEKQALIREALDSDKRFLLVSNTGTLLETFKWFEQNIGGNPIALENNLLRAFSSSMPQRWDYGGAVFIIMNLSMMDNLSIGEKVFRRMVAPECWQACESSECQNFCPIYQNVKLIQENVDVAASRVCMVYRRMYEYGTRLTLRQMCAHLAYMITSGLTYTDIIKLSRKPSLPLMAEFMFFNRFFGDNGREEDASAGQLSAIRAVRDQHFGVRNSPTWERRLWTEGSPNALQLNARGCREEFEALRRCGAGLSTTEEYSSPRAVARARDQVRRMLFFLHAFEDGDDGCFLRGFLNSAMILDFMRWQKGDTISLSLEETTRLRRSIFHVLQEQFTGVRLPEGTPPDSHLFITLARRGGEIRQSAQVVLARVPQEALNLDLISRDDGMGWVRRELILRGQQEHRVELVLTLPFLDYVMMRNEGAIGEDLQKSYVDRLERFKAQLLAQAAAVSQGDIMLVRLRTNHTFRRQIFAVRNKRLEVTDA
jgi:serine/threonine protein kinase